MRVRWILAGLLLFGAMWLAWQWGLFNPLIVRLEGFANRPEVQREFNDPVAGRVDAMILMISLFVLAPAAVVLGLLVFVFAFICVSLLLEPLFRGLSLPSWTAVPVVFVGGGFGLYELHGLWLPQALYILALIVRAWMVYFGTSFTAPR